MIFSPQIITVWTVVQTVLTATFNFYGNRQISTLYKINTPEPIENKFGTIYYVREETPCTKFGTNPPTESFWANGWNITKIIFIYLYLFSEARAQVRPVDGFLRMIAQKTWNHARMCLFGVIKLKFNFKPLFIPQSRQILAKNGTVFCDRKRLTMGKLPLIIIVVNTIQYINIYRARPYRIVH